MKNLFYSRDSHFKQLESVFKAETNCPDHPLGLPPDKLKWEKDIKGVCVFKACVKDNILYRWQNKEVAVCTSWG
ncbi:hypothetical protein TWF132_010631 [Orbilia oligospora]|nr:hypothetical protein TWF132_010631 [Orbilia oligospora]